MSAAPPDPSLPSASAVAAVTSVRLRSAVGLAIALTLLCVVSIGCGAYAVYADWTTWALMGGLSQTPVRSAMPT
ncbi:hypothetical protein ACFWG0_27490 [Streptomyces yangpuensis]|uniref:hypothetical protein n=1 Tax=Streptomyces yangpuensis TaxID=1648182 RepID=UPI00366A1356